MFLLAEMLLSERLVMPLFFKSAQPIIPIVERVSGLATASDIAREASALFAGPVLVYRMNLKQIIWRWFMYKLVLLCAAPAGEKLIDLRFFSDGRIFLFTDKNVYELQKV